MISKLARIGTSGKNPSNAERDLHGVLDKLCHLKPEVERIRVRMWDHKNACINTTELPIVMPDKMAMALWELGPRVFEFIFFGTMTRGQVKEYWDHVANSGAEWFREHPMFTFPRRDCLIPLSTYGDEVNTYRNSEVGTIVVLGWTSDFAYHRTAINRYLLLTTYSDYTASDFTYEDIMGEVGKRITRMVDPVERFPWSDQYQFMFSSNQGDLKFLLQKHYVQPYLNNEFCTFCDCQKTHADVSMTLGDMREEAAHRRTLVTHAEYLRRTTPLNSSLLVRAAHSLSFLCVCVCWSSSLYLELCILILVLYVAGSITSQIPGFHVHRFLHDVLHGQLLGTGKLLNGTAAI